MLLESRSRFPIGVHARVQGMDSLGGRALARSAAMHVAAAQRPTVLIVDDYPHVRTALRRLLAREFDLIEAGSAAEAADVLTARNVDVVLLDIGLPDRDGLQWLTETKARMEHLRAIVVSGEADASIVRAAYRAGAVGFVQKPFTRATLLGEIQAALADPDGEAVSRVRAKAAFPILLESARTAEAKGA